MAVLTPADKRRLLSNVTLFVGLAPAELDAIVPVSRTVTLKKREQLFHKGDQSAQALLMLQI